VKETGLLRRSGKAEEIAYTALFRRARRVLVYHRRRHRRRRWMVLRPLRYLTNERSRHMLQLLNAKDKAEQGLQR
jgi:hypothetical protein